MKTQESDHEDEKDEEEGQHGHRVIVRAKVVLVDLCMEIIEY